jgi:hypothetical protein
MFFINQIPVFIREGSNMMQDRSSDEEGRQALGLGVE